MSRKAECPGCNGYTSSIRAALDRGEPCPYCGLSADVIEAVHAARERFDESELRDQLEAALVRAAKAEKERDQAEAALRRIVDAVRDATATITRRRPAMASEQLIVTEEARDDG